MIHYALILAAGKGSRVKYNKTPKQFLELNCLPIVMHSAKVFSRAHPETILYIALPNKYELEWAKLCKKYHFDTEHTIYTGGKRRIETVFKGLKSIHNNVMNRFNYNEAKKALVSIHDAARPFINEKFILELIHNANRFNTAIPILNLKNSLRTFTQEPQKSISINRESYITTQTPQVFNLFNIHEAYVRAHESHSLDSYQSHVRNFKKSNTMFDDASVYDYFSKAPPIHTVEGLEHNIKITTDLDYFLSPMIYKFIKKYQ